MNSNEIKKKNGHWSLGFRNYLGHWSLVIGNSQKGIALIWALMVSAIVLVITSTMFVLVIKEFRITSNMDESARAYLAAEAGMEKALYEIRNSIDSNVDWCNILNYNGNPTSDVGYSVSVVQEDPDCNPLRQMLITSTGNSRNSTTRRLQSRIYLVPPSGGLNRFDNFTPIPFNLPAIITNPLQKSLIVQQFDVTGLINLPNGNSFTVGMNNGTPATNFGVLIRRVGGQIRVQLTGSVAANASLSSNTFSFARNVSIITYRVKLEYSRQGDYTVVRAIVLEKDPANTGQANYRCISNCSSITYGAVSQTGPNVTMARILPGFWVLDPDDPLSGYIRVTGAYPNDVKVDDMVFWTRE